MIPRTANLTHLSPIERGPFSTSSAPASSNALTIVAMATTVNLCLPSDVVLDLLPKKIPDGTASRDDGTAFLRDYLSKSDNSDLAEAVELTGLPTADLTDRGRTFFSYFNLDRHGDRSDRLPVALDS